jgi:hypothetical protein
MLVSAGGKGETSVRGRNTTTQAKRIATGFSSRRFQCSSGDGARCAAAAGTTEPRAFPRRFLEVSRAAQAPGQPRRWTTRREHIYLFNFVVTVTKATGGLFLEPHLDAIEKCRGQPGQFPVSHRTVRIRILKEQRWKLKFLVRGRRARRVLVVGQFPVSASGTNSFFGRVSAATA